jgi:hypothetical protein
MPTTSPTFCRRASARVSTPVPQPTSSTLAFAGKATSARKSRRIARWCGPAATSLEDAGEAFLLGGVEFGKRGPHHRQKTTLWQCLRKNLVCVRVSEVLPRSGNLVAEKPRSLGSSVIRGDRALALRVQALWSTRRQKLGFDHVPYGHTLHNRNKRNKKQRGPKARESSQGGKHESSRRRTSRPKRPR